MKKLFYAAVLTLTGLILFRAEAIMNHTKETLIMCFNIIIPSLFPFFVCSSLLIYSGFGTVIAKYAEKIMRPLFNVAPAGAAALVVGIISGFPSGAICTADLYASGNLSEIEAERLLAFCNNSGPLFIIGSVGIAIYSSPLLGAVLYAVHIMSSLIVGVIFSNYGKSRHNSPPTAVNTKEFTLSQSVSESIRTASKNILTVCFSIIFFAPIAQTVLELIPMSRFSDAVLSGIFEFSSGILKISQIDDSMIKKLAITSFILGFSGISVHLQVMAVTSKSDLSLKPYFLGKILHAFLSAFICALIMLLLNAKPVFSGSSAVLSAGFMSTSLFVIISAAAIFAATAVCYRRNAQKN